MKKLKSFVCMLVLMCSAFCLYACKKGDDDKAKLTSVTTNMKEFYRTTETIDWQSIQVTAKYSDDTTKTLTKGEFDVDVKDRKSDTEWVLNTNGLKTAETKTAKEYNLSLYIAENGKTYPITITVYDDESTISELGSFEEPNNIQLWREHTNTENVSGFKTVENAEYYVGADNPFVITPEYSVYKINSEEDIDIQIALDVNVYEGATKVGTETYTYADDAIQFNSSAIGHTYTIKIRPKYFTLTAYGETISEVSFDVTVQEGYNVDSALDLGMLSIAPAGTQSGDYRQVTSNEIFYNPNTSGKELYTSKNNSELWRTFLKSKGYTDSELNYTKGIFLHGDINITSDDIPSDFLYTDPNEYTNNDWHMGKLRDFSYIYVHYMKDDLNFEGNYFTLDASQIPVNGDYDNTIIETDKKGEDHNFGHSKLFYFAGLSTTYDDDTINHSRNNQHKVVMQNVNSIGNTNESISINESSEHVADQYAAAGGLIMFTNAGCGAEVENVNISAAMIGWFVEGTEKAYEDKNIQAQKTVLDKMVIKNCFDSGIFDWGGQGGLEIKDSTLKNFGGPAIFVVSKAYDNDGSEELGSYVTYDENTVIESYIGGNEAWFNVTEGANLAVMQIAVFDQMIKEYKKTYYKDVQGDSKFNFKVLIMDERIFNAKNSVLYATVNNYYIKMPTNGEMYPATQYGMPFFWTNKLVNGCTLDQGFLIPANSFATDASGTKNNPAMVIDPTNFTGNNFGDCIRNTSSQPLTGNEMCLVLPMSETCILGAIVDMYNVTQAE